MSAYVLQFWYFFLKLDPLEIQSVNLFSHNNVIEIFQWLSKQLDQVALRFDSCGALFGWMISEAFLKLIYESRQSSRMCGWEALGGALLEPDIGEFTLVAYLKTWLLVHRGELVHCVIDLKDEGSLVPGQSLVEGETIIC